MKLSLAFLIAVMALASNSFAADKNLTKAEEALSRDLNVLVDEDISDVQISKCQNWDGESKTVLFITRTIGRSHERRILVDGVEFGFNEGETTLSPIKWAGTWGKSIFMSKCK
jgi:hypothetical protein